MFARLFSLAILTCSSLGAVAQQNILSGNDDGGTNLNVLYRNDYSGKLYAHTRGFGFLFRQGKHISTKTRSYYEIDLQTLRHPKEVKSAGESETRRRFVYGKVNSVFVVRGAVGVQNVMFYKADLKAVEVRYAYSIGPSFAFAKPYYVQVYKNSSANKQTQTTLVRFDRENFTQDSGQITGRAPYAKGIAEMKIYPGITGKFNLSFEYAPYTNLIRAIETGVTVDYFPKALPIMARNPAENVIVTLNVGFVFGRKRF